MTYDLNLRETKKKWHGTLKSYIIGFIASFLLTSASFLLVITRPVSGKTLVYTIAGLALVQALFQLRFFLHLGHEDKPRWETLLFCFMVFILLVIVIGSLWIMFDLDYRVMSSMREAGSHD